MSREETAVTEGTREHPDRGSPLYVGEMWVNFADDFDGEFTLTFEAWDRAQGRFEIRTISYALDHLDYPDLDAADEETLDALRSEMRSLIDDMRHALARCGLLGTMRLGYTERVEDRQLWSIFEGVVDGLPDDHLVITTETMIQAHEANRDEAAARVRWLKGLQRTANEVGLRRGLNKEQREEMTLGEVMAAKDEEGPST
jgi:hypothetical protein